MNPHREISSGTTPSCFSGSALSGSLEALRAPAAIRPVSTRLLASKTRGDGVVDELYHEIPSFDGHKGALFYISESPLTGSQSTQVAQRILYAMVPRADSAQFISGVVENFNSSEASRFEQVFTGSFGGTVLIENSQAIGK